MSEFVLDGLTVPRAIALELVALQVRSSAVEVARRNGWRMSPELVRWFDSLDAFALDARARRESVGNVGREAGDPVGNPRSIPSMQISTAAAARRLKVGPRRITGLIAEGVLHGSNPTGRGWVVDAVSVDNEARRRGLAS